MADPSRTWLVIFAVGGLLALGALALMPPAAPGRPTGSVDHPYSAEHRVMLQRMQTDTGPAMVERMRGEPLWEAMRDPRAIRVMEQERADFDRMLGRNPAPP
jgi:hypothetical protein